MERIDTFLLGFVAGMGTLAAGIGLCQILVTKGYMIAVELVEAGWHAHDLRAHRKAAIVLPFIQRARAAGDSER